MLKYKKLLKLGFIFKEKRLRNKSVYTPKSYYGECHFNLQKFKAHYHRLRVRYLKTLCKKLRKEGGNLQEKLVESLESRVDSVLLRSKLVSSHAEASQLINHGHVLLNDRKMDIRSLIMKPNDRLTLKLTRLNLDSERLIELSKELPPYIKVNEGGEIILTGKPILRDINFKVKIDFDKVTSALRK